MKFAYCVRHYDNATAAVRSYLGDAYNPQYCTSLVNIFCAVFLNPFVKFPSIMFLPEVIKDTQENKRKKYRYKGVMTPYEKFQSISRASEYLEERTRSNNWMRRQQR
ncbi:MAG: hypothetical protein Q8K74_07990 [Candidatus Nitrotoga sp.]|nr:hypothetical protein [Candidatus Nitrotoga sp.]MDP1855973.1 hypothetical protein [Candidatus Nitrotoga sp.]